MIFREGGGAMLHVSPSKVARYFYHECERHFVYHAVSKKDREMMGIPDEEWKENPVLVSIAKQYGIEIKI